MAAQASVRSKRKPKGKPRKKRPRGKVRQTFINQEATFLFNLAPRFLKMLERFEDAFQQHPATYAAISAVTRNVAGVPLKIMTGDRKDPKILESGPWWELFERINPHFDQQLFVEAVVVHLESPAGEVFVVLEAEGDERLKKGEIPFELWPLSGKLFTPRFEKAQNGMRQLIGWRYRDPDSGGFIDYALHEVVQIRNYNPSNPLRGLGPGEAAKMTARSDWKARIFDEAILDNGGMPGGWLVTDDEIDDEEYDQEISRHEDRFSGPTKAGRILLLSGGKTFVPNPQTTKDMQYREKLEWGRDEILMVHGVPKSEVGIEQPANMITGSGRLSGNRSFWTGKLLPVMGKITRAFWHQLFNPVTGGTIWVEFDEDVVQALKPNLNESLEAATKGRDLGVPLNELIDAHQLPYQKQPHGDVALIPPGFVPADALGLPDDEFVFDEDEDLADIMDEEEEPDIMDLSSPDMERARAAVQAMMSKRDIRHDKAWLRIAAGVMDPMGSRIRARFRKYLMALRANQLRILQKELVEPVTEALHSALVRGGGNGNGSAFGGQRVASPQKSTDQLLFDEEKWNKKLVRAHLPLYVETALRSIDQADKEVDEQEAERVPKGRRPRIAKEVAKLRAQVLVKANRAIRKRLARQIDKGIAAGERTRVIAKRVRKVFNTVSRKWSLVIARTEVSSVVNEARIRTFIERKRRFHIWVTARDEAVRPTHARQDGMILEIGKRFPNGLRWPLDLGPPSEVVNCRCVTIPS